LAATNRPTSRSRIGSDGNALQSSLRGDGFGCGLAMQHMLQKMRFHATYETRFVSAWPKIAAVGRILRCDDSHARTCPAPAVAQSTDP
jgi:hypothetical protein